MRFELKRRKLRTHVCAEAFGTVPGSTMTGYRTAARSSLRPMVRDDKSRIRPNRRPAMRLSKTRQKKARCPLRPCTKEIVAGAAACGAARAGSPGTEPEQPSHNSFTEHRSKTDCT
jgi:hypothetical protein